MKKATEMMVTVNGGWLYFKAAAKTANAGFDRLLEAFEDAGIDVSNVEFGSCELCDENGNAMDDFQINLDEWTELEEFLEIPLTYKQYEAVADYCNNDAEIDGNILDIAVFEDRKPDLFAVARNAERVKR